jgi:DNA repair protein RecN (Recombination protein N)
MLKLLSISNFAVVSEVTIEFGDGLNLLTGETGSGKSIVVDALGLLLGARASGDIVRTGESAAFIEGVFDVERNTEVLRIAGDAGIDPGDGELIIRREISDRSRSRAFVNDRLATLSLLRDLRPYLVDIHGQGDQQTLLYPEAHIDLLDEFGGLASLRAEVEAAWSRFTAARRELASLQRSEAERLRSLDVLEFQVAEIEKAAVTVGEDETLEAEREILANAEKLLELSGESYGNLYENEQAVLPLLGQVQRRIEQLAQYDSRFKPYLETLQTSRYSLEDLAYFLRDYAEDADFSPERLKAVEDRLLELDRLKRKYGASLVEVQASLDDMRARLAELTGFEERSSSIQRVLEESRASYLSVARELSRARRKAGRRLEERVAAELSDLAMGDAVFLVRIESGSGEESFTQTGLDNVEFFISTNPGEEPRPLARIASGGEISRLMLALKTVSAPPEIPRTLVFDEVDVGIGGRVSDAVGQRLSRLSHANQILCVTHQAQIARFADQHFTVRKRPAGDRVETEVARLDRRGQIEELARMLGGADVTETARRHARELLKAGK